MSLRFDDTLETVLAADLTTPHAVQSVWRQLVDLAGRRCVPVDARVIAKLDAIRAQVPLALRAATAARALEFSDPPYALVRLLVLDELAVAAPLLLGVRLTVAEWLELLPDLSPVARSLLGNRVDLDPRVHAILKGGSVVPDAGGGSEGFGAAAAAQQSAPDLDPPLAAQQPSPVPVGEVAARIDAYWRDREAREAEPRTLLRTGQFRFETDAKGVIRWVEGVNRAPLIGLGLQAQAMAEGSRIDAAAAGAFRHRADIANARMRIEGDSDAAGDWLISAVPAFDRATGRFAGYRGTARRPRADERVRAQPAGHAAADSLRQLMHELRTPTNAIAGFAEMIEAQMLGPVPEAYRRRAEVIRAHARDLLGAIEDLDLAARIDSAALALTPGAVALRPLLAAIAEDLGPLAKLRGAVVTLAGDDLAVAGDRRAVERLLSRLLATLVSAAGAGERIEVRTLLEGADMVAIAIDRPRALAEYPGDSVLGIDDEREDASLLGTGFALRLARNLARELGGSLVIESASLTLRLRAVVASPSGQAHSK